MKKNILLFTALMLCFYSCSKKDNSTSREGEKIKGNWTLSSDKKTLKYYGEIKEGDLNDLNSLDIKNIDRLIVNSTGGDAKEGLEIGKVIHQNKWNIEVENICASSCANYFFPAANKKVVNKNALLAFHGGIGTSGSDNYRKILKELGLSESQIKSQIIIFKKDSINEFNFFKEINVDIRILEKSEELTMDNKNKFWSPPKSTYDKVNIKNITSFWYPKNESELKALGKKKDPDNKIIIFGGDIEDLN